MRSVPPAVETQGFPEGVDHGARSIEASSGRAKRRSWRRRQARPSSPVVRLARCFGPGPPLARALLPPTPDNGSMGWSGVGTVWSTLQATDSPTAEGCRHSLAMFRLVLDAFHRSGQSAGRLFYSRRRPVLGGAVSFESSVWLYVGRGITRQPAGVGLIYLPGIRSEEELTWGSSWCSGCEIACWH